MEPNFRNLTDSDFGTHKKAQHPPLQNITRPHVDSFNHMLMFGLSEAVKNILPIEFALHTGQRVSLFVYDAKISSPTVAQGNMHVTNLKVFPSECRERGVTYKGRLYLHIGWTVDGRRFGPEERMVGEVPIMVKSRACNLNNLKPAELVRHGEEAEEMGGYFVINGNERIIRMLVMPRRNYPTALTRGSWKNRGPQYTEYGVSMRCASSDHTSATIVLHYLNNGSANLSFTYRKEQFFIPIILIMKSIVDVTDQFIFSRLIQGKEDDSFYKGCIGNMLRQVQSEGHTSRSKVNQFLGRRFRIKVNVPEWYTDSQVADYLLRQCVCIHLDDNMDKFDVLVYMTRKLFTFAKHGCSAESADNPMFQEALLGGQLYQMVLKEKIESWLVSLKATLEKKCAQKSSSFVLDSAAVLEASRKCLDIAKSMEYLMATGNLVSKSGLGLMQMSGLTVVADKLNFYRYLSHFRCIHRGAFFAEMRTTEVRRLLPEAWGFICPVHTPDGSPCGLLNHLTASCQVVNTRYTTDKLPALLTSLGMSGIRDPLSLPVSQHYPVMLDGRVLGWIPDNVVHDVAKQLRALKVQLLQDVPEMMEICLVPKTPVASQYPGLYLFTSLTRLMRPVTNLAYDRVEMIGTFEQVYLDICIIPEEAIAGVTTHQELSQSAMLSVIASLTPFSDFNQSPRNMYQCQMGKQTMGFPLHAWSHRSDNKLYRLHTPQSPIVRPALHDYYGIDNYPLGTNAVVAVISYTGYDMEDAMILNKGSFERGFGFGTVVKSEFIDLKEISGERLRTSLVFGLKTGDAKAAGKLDSDGLPFVGTYLQEGEPYYSYINIQTGESRVVLYKGQEAAFVDQVKVLGNDLGTGDLQRICVVLRIPRNPIVGDKFSSRHGQKGICSQKWPVQDMPFTESGMTPDILFNPHGFPSRMTIGMMIESMAGKSGAVHGLCHDASPFTFSEDQPAVDHFGQMLTAAGYNYFGTERLYSGINGRELEADIFIGVVYYQRLRHMVSDKFQVRTTGPVDILTHQPVKGRKKGGGVRFGEMERDALLAHGTSFLLHDRLLNCSDKSLARVCSQCGSLLSPLLEKPASARAAASYEATRQWTCSVCKRRDTVRLITVPYVFRYLVAELAAMNIETTLKIKNTTEPD